MKDKELTAATAIIESTVRKGLGDEIINRIVVRTDEDWMGDPCFRIHVVFRGEGPLDVSKTVKLGAATRLRLLEEGDDTFPMISFVAEGEAHEIGL